MPFSPRTIGDDNHSLLNIFMNDSFHKNVVDLACYSVIYVSKFHQQCTLTSKYRSDR